MVPSSIIEGPRAPITPQPVLIARGAATLTPVATSPTDQSRLRKACDVDEVRGMEEGEAKVTCISLEGTHGGEEKGRKGTRGGAKLEN